MSCYEHIAEVGCGAGSVISGIVDRISSIRKAEGWDISQDAIDLAKAKENEKLSYIVGNFVENKSAYDLVLCIDVFEHVPDYLGFLNRLKDCASYFVFHIPLDMHCSAILRGRHVSVRQSVGHLHYFSRATAIETLNDSGYSIIAERFTNGAVAGLSGHRGWKTEIANVARRLFPDSLSAKLFGGYSLLVLAKKGSP